MFRLSFSLLLSVLFCAGCTESPPEGWPPEVGKRYPDLELIDHTGKKVKLSSFQGQVILVELVGMPCAGCQAFSGGHKYGAFAGGPVQKDLSSLEYYYKRYTGGISFWDDRVVLIQLLLYDMDMNSPTPEDARKWAEHFRLNRRDNCRVLAGTRALMGPAIQAAIPGFHLIDKDFKLVVDATGEKQVKLYDELLPKIQPLLRKKPDSLRAGF